MPDRKLRYFIHGIMERDPHRPVLGVALNAFLFLLILLSVTAIILESEHGIYQAWSGLFAGLELLCIAVFTVEYGLRLWCAPEDRRFDSLPAWKARLRYAVTPMAIIDLLAVLPFYLGALAPVDLLFLRLLRLLRLLKLSHYVRGLDVFFHVLRAEGRTMSSVLFIALVLIIFTACTMHLLERTAQPEAFGSIPRAVWWTVVTMTTVGYGDVTPVTLGGRVMAVVVMLMGVGLVALPAGMLAAKFAEELRTRREELEERVRDILTEGEADAAARSDLRRRSHELGITAEELEQIIRNEKRHGQGDTSLTCPHCGKPVRKPGESRAG